MNAPMDGVCKASLNRFVCFSFDRRVLTQVAMKPQLKSKREETRRRRMPALPLDLKTNLVEPPPITKCHVAEGQCPEETIRLIVTRRVELTAWPEMEIPCWVPSRFSFIFVTGGAD
ncbi:hypothetical protein BHE74_00020460 [Ensete ventricosum]|nr:hypothetical protein BHE74_00020460 [Ensete ventricosum]